jgi:hypothetical protein
MHIKNIEAKEQHMDFSHQPKKRDANILWGTLIFWTVLAGVFLPYLSELKTNEQAKAFELPFQIFMVLFFLFWIVFSILGLIHAKRHRLHVTEEFVEQWGIFRHQKIDLDAVISADWRPTIWNPKRIDLQTSDAKVAVSFQELSEAETKELILFF